MRRNDWGAVYDNQKKVLAALNPIEEIFLGGGTAIQYYVLKQRYRESEDLDFFVDHKMQKGERASISRKMINCLRGAGIEIDHNLTTEQGTIRIFCGFRDNDEQIKIELLDFTTERFGDLSYIEHHDFPRIENAYNLLLYKLKALHDRQDTVKDLFDIFFLFKVLGAVNTKEMLTDLNLKFEETTNYNYREKEVLKAFSVKRREWDIIPSEVTLSNWQHVKIAVEDFRKAFLSEFLNPESETLDFTYATYLKQNALKEEVTEEEYLDVFETNRFIEKECRNDISTKRH